jgi:hypothetical protein
LVLAATSTQAPLAMLLCAFRHCGWGTSELTALILNPSPIALCFRRKISRVDLNYPSYRCASYREIISAIKLAVSSEVREIPRKYSKISLYL